MSQLIKYEFRNSRRQITQLIVIIGIVSLVLQVIFNGFVRMQIANIEITGPLSVISTLSALIVAGSGFLIFGTVVTYYLRLANILKTDIYQNRGYITFSLPRSGYQIIGAKLVVAIFWSFILPLVVILWNALIWMILWILIPGLVVPTELQNILSQIGVELSKFFQQINIPFILSIAFTGVTSSVFYLLLIFTAIIVDYKIGRRKSDSSRWIIYAIIFAIFWTFIKTQIFSSAELNVMQDNLYPYSINFEEIVSQFTKDNLITGAFNGLVAVLLFIFVGYNLEKKIEK